MARVSKSRFCVLLVVTDAAEKGHKAVDLYFHFEKYMWMHFYEYFIFIFGS